jgi:tetratricopeptide (TPR) repeat protein
MLSSTPARAAQALALSTLLLASATLLIATTPARAADPAPTDYSPAQDRLDPARALIRQERWRDAITALQQVDDRASADWNNLMGYSHRKSAAPDHAAAARYYEAALRIDPRHRGALAYSGELALTLGDLPGAEERLARLGRVCTSGCPEHSELRKSIEAYKAAGGKTAARP